MQSTEFTCPQRRNEFWQTKVKAIITYESLRWKKTLLKLSKKMEKKIVRKTTYVSKGPDVTLRNTGGHKNSDVLSMPRQTERILQTWNFDSISSESRNWPDENLQGQAVHTKNKRLLKHDAEPSQTYHSIKISKKINKKMYINVGS